MTLLWSLLILAGLGLVFGVALVLFGVLFHVQEDERIKEVEKMLPNYNCGACGYAGCRQMAENLVSGKETMVSKCKPGKKDKNYDPIVAYLAAHPDPDGTTHVPKI
ncbi:MAG: electron transporter RnfB [Bacilli bacterium]|nr:electron transporter RnfB [Bacilli bacterium]